MKVNDEWKQNFWDEKLNETRQISSYNFNIIPTFDNQFPLISINGSIVSIVRQKV